ncbi:hypothetical protein Fleli_0271 [Bernardetia litoralis DSM 6794]|uniref:Uncharacterized protein n=1 Tax=Bernardetia litoralis (strain ATCC 23117 / DSM 6794 / NBRC 15988 / NCIMB 1366 / Fx l1 / Sio-4) TaxID=880071 RepID=I4AFM5_BERLS|nr:hypothetical protein [Bernardetia litoralis]AFM02760.1 hypothetical protein Fleli_0271 [Bernardetia litoralis DSM 6794]
MIENIKKTLNKKHLLIIGRTEIERQNFVSEIIKIANFETFRFPSKMKSFDNYFESMEKMKLYKPWYESKSYNGNAVWDFHRDWISENNSLLVLEEIQDMEERWKFEIIRLCINETEYKKKGNDTIHLIISQENEDGLIDQLANSIFPKRDNERRTKRQIIEQNLGIIDIS